MAYFEGYNTNDANAGKYVKIGVVKTTINASVTELEIETPESVPKNYEGSVILIGTELLLVTGINGAKWTVTRGYRGTTGASHSNGAEIKSAEGQGNGYVPLMPKQELILGPIQTQKAEKIGGSIYSEKGGTLFIQQSFDGGLHWDISVEKTITAGTAATIEQALIAPYAQVKFVNGTEESKEVRLFARAAWQQGR